MVARVSTALFTITVLVISVCASVRAGEVTTVTLKDSWCESAEPSKTQKQIDAPCDEEKVLAKAERLLRRKIDAHFKDRDVIPEYSVVPMLASFYGGKTDKRVREGALMANQKPFRSADPTIVAVPEGFLPQNTVLFALNPKKGTTQMLKVVDGCGCPKGRQLDVSRGAAERLGMIHDGVAVLLVAVVKTPS